MYSNETALFIHIPQRYHPSTSGSTGYTGRNGVHLRAPSSVHTYSGGSRGKRSRTHGREGRSIQIKKLINQATKTKQ